MLQKWKSGDKQEQFHDDAQSRHIDRGGSRGRGGGQWLPQAAMFLRVNYTIKKLFTRKDN